MTRRGTAREIWNSRASVRELIAGWFGEDNDEGDAGVGEVVAWRARDAEWERTSMQVLAKV